MTEGSQDRLRAGALPDNDLGQVVHTVQIGTGFTAGKVTPVICGGLALLPDSSGTGSPVSGGR